MSTVETAVRERPILFSGPMVRAILDGRKTQTRRVMKPQPVFVPAGELGRWEWGTRGWSVAWVNGKHSGVGDLLCRATAPYERETTCLSPYGAPGDRLWKDYPGYGDPYDRVSGYHRGPNTDEDAGTDAEADPRFPERRLHGGERRADLQPNEVQGVRQEGVRGLVPPERLHKLEGLPISEPLAQQREGDEECASTSLYGVSRNAGNGDDAGSTLGRRSDEQPAVESGVGFSVRELGGSSGARASSLRGGSPRREAVERRAGAPALGAVEGAVQSEAGGTNAGHVAGVNRGDRRDGDRLWVRESYRLPASLDDLSPREAASRCLDAGYRRPWCPIRYEADAATTNADEWWVNGQRVAGCNIEWGKLRPSIHMPRWASRLTLEITDVRVERVQDISEADAIAEGARRFDEIPTASPPWSPPNRWSCKDDPPNTDHCLSSARYAFANLWNEINGPRGYGWDANPWVWVLSFKRARDLLAVALKHRGHDVPQS